MAAHFKIRTEKTGHYFTHGQLGPSTKYVWICLHGYGQLGRFFIQRFEFLDPSRHYVIAPEGLNRFYFEGVNERPVSNWMTREDRLDDIADFIGFLESLRAKLRYDRHPDIQVIYLGFSQGVTTVLRWLHDIRPRVDHLLLWAGGLPDDLLFDFQQEYFSGVKAHYFLGDKDPYFTSTSIKDKTPLIRQTGLNLNINLFHGSHTVDEHTLQQWMDVHLA